MIIFKKRDNGELKVIAKIGGPYSDSEFVNSNEMHHKQNTAYQLKSGNIILFDNGDLITRNCSRVFG